MYKKRDSRNSRVPSSTIKINVVIEVHLVVVGSLALRLCLSIIEQTISSPCANRQSSGGDWHHTGAGHFE